MDKNKFWLGVRLFNIASPRLGAPTQRKARPQVGRPNATQGTSASWVPNACPQGKRKTRPHVHKLGAPTQCKARPQVGRPNATQGKFARWAPKRKTHPQRKRPHKGALGKKTSWRMDKNKFWLGGRLFNMASPSLGTPTQRKARPQDGRPNATQGTSASWAARHIRKMGAQVGRTTQRKTDPQRKRPHKGALG
jgi:hypothetical protein